MCDRLQLRTCDQREEFQARFSRDCTGLFKWRQFEPEVFLLAVGWYLRFSLSYRDVENCWPSVSVLLTARLGGIARETIKSQGRRLFALLLVSAAVRLREASGLFLAFLPRSLDAV